MEPPLIGHRPELSGGDQAEPTTEQGHRKPRVHQGHAGIPLEQDAAGREHPRHPDRDAPHLDRFTAGHQACQGTPIGSVDIHGSVLAGQGQQHGLAAIGPGGQDQAPHLLPQLGEGLKGELQHRATAELQIDRREGPVRLIKGDATGAQRMVHADLGGLGRRGRRAIGWSRRQDAQIGRELFRPAGRIALNGEAIEGHGEAGVAAAVRELQIVAGGQELLEALAAEGPPGGPHHQQHHARMHEEGAHPAGHPPACRKAPRLLPHLPSPTDQEAFQVAQIGLGIGAWERFGHTQLAQLAGLAIVDPAERGLQGRPLAAPTAEEQRQPQPGQQGEEPAAGIHMVELQPQHAIAPHQAEPGRGVIELVVEGLALFLGDGGADAACHGDHEQQHDRHPQVGDPGHQA